MIFQLLSTSGTSGKPKGVTLSHKALIHNLFASLNIIKDFEIDKKGLFLFTIISFIRENGRTLFSFINRLKFTFALL